MLITDVLRILNVIMKYLSYQDFMLTNSTFTFTIQSVTQAQLEVIASLN